MWGFEPTTSWSSKMHRTSQERATICEATACSAPSAAAHLLVRGLSLWARRRSSRSGGKYMQTQGIHRRLLKTKHPRILWVFFLLETSRTQNLKLKINEVQFITCFNRLMISIRLLYHQFFYKSSQNYRKEINI